MSTTGNNSSNNNRKGQNPLTRSYDSSGPDVKIRGTAQNIAEKYMTLARDATSSGDRVMAENYLQHAEHYNRIIAAAQAMYQERYQRDERSEYNDRGDYNERDDDDNDNSGQDNAQGEQPQQQYQQREQQYQPRESQQQREPQQQREHREPREQREQREAPQQREAQQPREQQPQRESQPRESQPREAPQQREAQPPREQQPQREQQPRREPRPPREPREPRPQTVAVEQPRVVIDASTPQPVIEGTPAEVQIEEQESTAATAAPARRRTAGRPRRTPRAAADGTEAAPEAAAPVEVPAE